MQGLFIKNARCLYIEYFASKSMGIIPGFSRSPVSVKMAFPGFAIALESSLVDMQPVSGREIFCKSTGFHRRRGQ